MVDPAPHLASGVDEIVDTVRVSTIGADRVVVVGLSAEALVEMLGSHLPSAQIHLTASDPDRSVDAELMDRLIQTWGLSRREVEMLHLITAGLSNQQIADYCYLSINSVKTYIRTAYRKIGASRRSLAVVWGLSNGLGH